MSVRLLWTGIPHGCGATRHQAVRGRLLGSLGRILLWPTPRFFLTASFGPAMPQVLLCLQRDSRWLLAYLLSAAGDKGRSSQHRRAQKAHRQAQGAAGRPGSGKPVPMAIPATLHSHTCWLLSGSPVYAVSDHCQSRILVHMHAWKLSLKADKLSPSCCCMMFWAAT